MPNTPHLLSQFYVEIDGLDESGAGDLMRDLIDVTVESSLHLPDVTTLVLHDPRLSWVDDARLEPGRGLRVSAKGAAGEHPVFDGEVVELEPEFGTSTHRLTVRAFDRLHRLARGRHARSFANVTDGDLVQRIVSDAGLRARVGATSHVHEYVFQNGETNLEFLRRRAAALGYLLFVEGMTVHFEPPERGGEAVELRWAESLLEFRPRMTTVAQVTSTTVRGWDPAGKQAIVGEAESGNGAPAIGERRRGGELARQAFNLEAPLLAIEQPVRSQAVADSLARSAADRRAGQFVQAEGSCVGNSNVVAGASVRITGVGHRFSGEYFITAAKHTYSAEGGYLTSFTISGLQPETLLSVLRPDAGKRPGTGLAIGIVTDNQDPDGVGRVKVRFPWLAAEHASDWARVVSPGAGAERGLQFLPEVNDEVLVGFELGDIHYPYVLGGLWNGRDAPPCAQDEAVSAGAVQRRVIRSRAGHKIVLDDSDGGAEVRIEDMRVNVIRLESGADSLHVSVHGDVTITADGRVSIRGRGVTIDAGGDDVVVTGRKIRLN
jgi:uncharacterized protein involved in type VI secretion and phage assembly